MLNPAVDFILKWQTLFGEVIGGLFALMVAMVVATSQARREQRAAASLLMIDLLSVVAMQEQITEQSKERGVSEEDFPLFIAEMLSHQRPKLSSLFEMEMVRVMDIDTHLSSHLSLFRMLYTGIDEPIRRLDEDVALRRSRGIVTAPRSLASSKADAHLAADSLRNAAAHADCAVYYMQALILHRLPTFSRLRMFLWRNQAEMNGRKLLKQGVVD